MIVYVVLALLIYSLLVCVSYLLIENRELKNKRKYLLHKIKEIKTKHKEDLIKKEEEVSKKVKSTVHKAWEKEYSKLLKECVIK